MGVFPHFFGGGPLKQITNFVLPGLPLLTQSIKAVQPLVSTGIQELHNIGAHSTTPKAAMPENVVHPGVYPTVQPQAPYVTAPNYYPSPFAPTPYSYAPTPDTFSPWGGPSWEYSTSSPPAWTQPSVTYLEAPTSRAGPTWEDLTSAFLPLIL